MASFFTDCLYRVHQSQNIFTINSTEPPLPVRNRVLAPLPIRKTRILSKSSFSGLSTREKLRVAFMDDFAGLLVIFCSVFSAVGFTVTSIREGGSKIGCLLLGVAYVAACVKSVKIIDIVYKRMNRLFSRNLNKYLTILVVKSVVEVLVEQKSESSAAMRCCPVISIEILLISSLFTRDSTGLSEGIGSAFCTAAIKKFLLSQASIRLLDCYLILVTLYSMAIQEIRAVYEAREREQS